MTGFNVQVDDSAVRLRFEELPGKVRTRLVIAVNKLTILMQAYVRGQKLAGQVLNYHTHHLQQAIQREVNETDTAVIGTVFVNESLAPYGAIHEFGGTIPGHEIVATKAAALAFLWHGKQAFFKRVYIPDVHMPERSYLRSSLQDKRDDIVSEITEAVKGGTQ